MVGKVYTLTLHRPVVSANKLLRMHWREYQDLLGEWKHDVYVLCRESKIPKLARIVVDADIYYSTRRQRDHDNFEYGLKKLLGDSLKGVVIFDDSPSYLTWGIIRHLHDSHSPRICIKISEDLH